MNEEVEPPVWYLLRWLCPALPIFVAGCVSVVYSEQPLGERIASFEPEEWNGVWVGNDGSFDRILITDAQNGMLAWGFKDRLCDSAPATKSDQYRQSGSWYFLVPPPISQGGRYEVGAAFFRDRDALTLYSINSERVRELIRKGEVPGYLGDNETVLGELASNHYGILLSIRQPAFDWKPTVVLIKLPPELDPCRPRAPSQ